MACGFTAAPKNQEHDDLSKLGVKFLQPKYNARAQELRFLF
jgi:hypothetical protein